MILGRAQYLKKKGVAFLNNLPFLYVLKLINARQKHNLTNPSF